MREEHAYKTFQKMLKAGVFPPVLLLFGKEQYLVDWAAKEMINALVNPASLALDLNRFSEEAVRISDIVNACETLPVFSSRKVVLAQDCDFLFSAQSFPGEKDAQEQLADYLKDPSPTTLLIFTAVKADKRKSLYKTIAKSGIAYEFTSIEGKSLADFIKKRLRASGKTASDQAIRTFVELTGYTDRESEYTLHNVVNDLQKAVALAEGPEVTALEFQEAAAGNSDTDAFALLDAAFSGNKGKALELLRNIIAAEKQSYSDGAVFLLIGLLCSQLEIILIAKERLLEGESFNSLPQSMGVKPFRLRKALEAAGNRSIEQIAESLGSAFGMEHDIKNGILPADLVLELFVAGL